MEDENEINETTMRNNSSDKESEDSQEENIVPIMDYNPNSDGRIINIELQNNQQIIMEYNDNWSVHDLILSILKRKEYRNLKQSRNLILNSSFHHELFDLALCFYDSIIQPHENRVDKYIMIGKLHELQIIKNYRTPFFIMKENFTPFDYIYKGEFQLGQLNEIQKLKYNQYAMYMDYLPRISKWVPNILSAHPELEDYFFRKRKFFNEFHPYKINILTCDNNRVDWFIYDKESINFLIEMEKKYFVENSNLKYIGNKLYLEDKTTHGNNNNKNADNELTDEDLNKVFINLTIDLSTPDNPKNIQSKKVKINTKTTAFNLIDNFCSKLGSMDNKIKLDPKKKILKVRSLNDYIFNIKEPLINFAYINECIRLNIIPEYLIIDNPELVTDNMNTTNTLSSSSTLTDNTEMNISSTINTTFKKNQNQSKIDVKNIATYNPMLSNIDDGFDTKICLDKGVNISKRKMHSNTIYNNKIQSKNSINNKSKKANDSGAGNTLESFVDYLENEIDKEVDEKLKGDINIKKKEVYINNYDYYMNSFLPKKKTFLKLINNNDSEYLKFRNKYKNFKINKKTPNIFSTSMGLNTLTGKNSIDGGKDNKIKNNSIYEKIKFKNIKKRKPLNNREYIKITHINRPFSILFRCAEINRLINSYDNDQKFSTVLLFKFELYNSNEMICPPKQIRWKTNTKVQRPYFNKRIYFDINYAQLPSFTSLIFKVKNIKYDKNSNALKSNTIFWANYRLFDQNNRLKVGLHKINLHEREVSDDIYFCFNDNPNEDKSSKLYFELENFAFPVINILKKNLNDNSQLNESQLFALEGGFLEKINKIDQKSPFDELNNYEKMTLWRNRFAVSGMASLIPRLFLSCDYNNPNTNAEIEQLTKVINGVSIIQAIELLSGRYVNEAIRKFAVNILHEASTVVIQSYLLQLIQALKYEKNHDSALARFLIEQAILHPITIGHEFFWHLRSEMFNQNVQQRFGLYLEVFLNKISRPLYKIFKEEDTLLKNLIVIAEKIKLKKNKAERDRIFKEDLNVVDGYLKINKKEVSLPLNFKYRIKGIIAEKCRIMKSKKKPLWLTFQNSDPLGDNIVVMLKCGDDLRMDMVTLQLFKAMQNLWYENGLKVKMSLYKVLCTGNQQGMLEMVTNAETLANIHVKEGGALNQIFNKVGIKKWIEKNCTIVSSQEAIENFMLSNVAYCLATFVLGIGDRHNDNIMIKKNGELFHIDFGHFLGHFKYKMGIKRERAAFIFTRQFQSVLGGDDSQLFLDFKKKMEKGYLILRNHKEVIVALLKILLCTGIPELNEKSLKFLENSLLLKKDDKEAIEFLNKKINESMDSMSTKLNFAIHIVANK